LPEISPEKPHEYAAAILRRIQIFWRYLLARSRASPIISNAIPVADALGKLAILFTIVNYFWEAPDRTRSRHYQAWQLIDLAHGVRGDGGRRDALKDLVADNVDLTGIDLSQANLDGFDFRGIRLRGATFIQSSLNNAKFGCKPGYRITYNIRDIYDTCLTVTSLYDIVFTNTPMSGVDFSGATLSNITFKQDDTLDNARVRSLIIGGSAFAYFNDTDINDTAFINASLSRVSFIGTTIYDVSISGGKLGAVDFRCAKISRLTLTNVELKKQSFSLSSVDLSHSNIEKSTVNGKPITEFDGSIFKLCHTIIDGVENNRDCGRFTSFGDPNKSCWEKR
jgi:uncharacterized protein YjbI with pentapeptide repeats